MRRTFLITIAALYLLANAPLALAKDKWINLRTSNFNIIANADEGDTRRLALKLEQFRAVLSKLLNTSRVAPVPITVLVFKNDGSFKPFKPLYNGKPANLSGFFQRTEDENIIALDISSNVEHPMEVVFHEYTHLLTAYTSKPLPVWLSEGLAEFYSTFDVNKNDVTIGKPLSRHVLLLRENKFVPFGTLFNVGHDSAVYNERDKQGIFYAESWALTHYLMYGNNHSRQPQLIQFLQALGRGAKPEAAFSEAFKTDFGSMEKELRQYIGKDSYPGMIYTLKSAEGEKEMDLRIPSEAEVQFQLGNLLMRTNRLDEAEKYLDRAASLDPKLAGIHEGRGFIALRRNNYSEAKEHFKQAVALGSQNHLVHYYYAETLQRELMNGNRTISLIDKDVARVMLEELKTSIKLMPGFAPAYNMLGLICLVSGENVNEGVEAINAALRLEPQNKMFMLNLAQLQFSMQDYAAAKKTLAPLLAGDDESNVRSAAQSLLSSISQYERTERDATEPVSSDREDTPVSERPQLKRRNGDAQDGPEEFQIQRSREKDGPSIKLAGTETLKGTMVALECGINTLALAFKSGDKLLRFKVSDTNQLKFFTNDPQFRPDIKCGPANIPGFIYFKPMPAGGKFAGEAVAIEIIKTQ